jgi:hypothetical protein
MALGGLYIIPQDDGALAEWSFANAAHHIDISRVIFELVQVRIDQYILDPFDPKNMGQWVYWHQLTHDAQNQVLGLKGWNLTAVNFNDPGDLRDWVYAHADEHYKAGAILGLG